MGESAEILARHSARIRDAGRNPAVMAEQRDAAPDPPRMEG
jgi:hypothetical protein